MIVDAHCHLDPQLPPDALLTAMERGGIDRAVLIAAAQKPIGHVGRAGPAVFRACMAIPPLRMPLYRVAARAGGVVPTPEPDNASVYAVARRHPDRFIPFAFLNPALGRRAHDELDRGLVEGARGVKLHAWFHGFRLTDAHEILERCAAKGFPVLVHLGSGPARDVEAVLDRIPRLKLIVAHAGMPHFERLWPIERLWFDVAAPQLVSKHMIRRLVGAVGAARVVYGSDAPIGIRAGGGHEYKAPPLPERSLGANLESLLA